MPVRLRRSSWLKEKNQKQQTRDRKPNLYINRAKGGVTQSSHLLLSENDGNFYTGSTKDLKRRLEEHNSGKVESTYKRRPLKLIYYEACISEEDARKRERYLKSGMGKKYLRNRLRDYLKNL